MAGGNIEAAVALLRRLQQQAGGGMSPDGSGAIPTMFNTSPRFIPGTEGSGQRGWDRESRTFTGDPFSRNGGYDTGNVDSSGPLIDLNNYDPSLLTDKNTQVDTYTSPQPAGGRNRALQEKYEAENFYNGR